MKTVVYCTVPLIYLHYRISGSSEVIKLARKIEIAAERGQKHPFCEVVHLARIYPTPEFDVWQDTFVQIIFHIFS